MKSADIALQETLQGMSDNETERGNFEIDAKTRTIRLSEQARDIFH
jgi:hypothetical protein